MSMSKSCVCSLRHSPPITKDETELHENPPLQWALRDPLGGSDARETIRLCANAHSLTHSLLDLYVDHDGTPPRALLRRFPIVVQRLGAEAWEAADHLLPLPHTSTCW